jgi:hypothetical protein
MTLSKLRIKQVMRHGVILLVTYLSEMYDCYLCHVVDVNTDTRQFLSCVLSVYFERLYFPIFSIILYARI